ncbi:MAG: metallophosphoesterase [Lachnospiraceae bacterium]|nr:metallophosphoesterase [Lachnospiraceae bacterium]
MKIAVLSDIHGNYVALEQCVNYALDKGIDTFIFLGDYLGELAYPQKTMKFLYSLKEKYQCWFIKGNKENYWLNYDQTWKENDSTTGVLYYTYHNLTDTDMDFFRKLNDKEEISFNGLPSITICHGSPNRVNEKLIPDNENTFSIMDNNKADYILCGHTHIQGVITHNQKVVWNAGSVGVPLHSNGKAQFLILSSTEDLTWKSEFVSLDYNVEKVIDDLHSSGLYNKAPGWSAVSEYLLRTGEISHGSVLARAMFLCREKTGQCNWPDVPEEYWEMAVNKMIPQTR